MGSGGAAVGEGPPLSLFPARGAPCGDAPGCPATSLGVCAPTAALLFQRASARRTSVSPTAGCLRASAGATRSAPAGLRM